MVSFADAYAMLQQKLKQAVELLHAWLACTEIKQRTRQAVVASVCAGRRVTGSRSLPRRQMRAIT